MREGQARLRVAAGDRHLVLTVVVLLVVVGSTLRALAVHAGWFHLDDYVLLREAMGRDLSVAYLLEPFDNQLMPGGRLIAWWVAGAGVLAWTTAATISAVWQALGLAAAAWALVTMFGLRWKVLVPIAVYVSTAMTMPALMWWAAAINQLPLEVALFLAVGSWVRYLRGDGDRWLLATAAAVVLGLLFYVKGLLLLGILAYLALAYFATGSILHRATTVVRRWPQAVVVGTVLAATYGVLYTVRAPEPYQSGAPSVLVETAEAMLATAFGSAAVGGPWRWDALGPGGVAADPPAWMLGLGWLVLSLVVLSLFVHRERTLRGWALVAAYLLLALALVVTSRAAAVGPDVGLEYRYLTDVAGVLVLGIGLATMPLIGAVESSRPRRAPYLALRTPSWIAPSLACVVIVSGLWSSARYVDDWRDNEGSDDYVETLAAQLEMHGAVELVDTPVPEEVLTGLNAPDNRLRVITDLLAADVTYPGHSSTLAMVAADGTLRRAHFEEPAATSRAGPVEGCGWPVQSSGEVFRLTQPTFDWVWWLRIGYLSSADSPVQVTVGGTVVETSVRAGLHSLYVRADGELEQVRIDGLDRGVTVCVDTVEVGEPEPGEPLA